MTHERTMKQYQTEQNLFEINNRLENILNYTEN